MPGRWCLRIKFRNFLCINHIIFDGRTGRGFTRGTASRNVCTGPTQFREWFGYACILVDDYPLFIGEPKPLSFELLLEHTVLFDKIIDERLLLAVMPAGQRDYEEAEGLYDRGHCPNRLAAILSDNNIIRLVRIFAPYGVDTRKSVCLTVLCSG